MGPVAPAGKKKGLKKIQPGSSGLVNFPCAIGQISGGWPAQEFSTPVCGSQVSGSAAALGAVATAVTKISPSTAGAEVFHRAAIRYPTAVPFSFPGKTYRKVRVSGTHDFYRYGLARLR